MVASVSKCRKFIVRSTLIDRGFIRRVFFSQLILSLTVLGYIGYYLTLSSKPASDATCSLLGSSLLKLHEHNSAELLNLQSFLARERHALRAVIVMLVKSKRMESLLQSLKVLMRNFNMRYRYPIVLFHEAEFLPLTGAARNAGALSNGSCVFFQLLNLQTPGWLLKKFGDASQWPRLPWVCNSSSIDLGYRHMCRFQSKLLYEQPVMSLFDYYWRLDDDSLITSTMPYDPFVQLRSAGCSYGYFQASIDECAHRLFDIAKEYMASRSINATFFNRLKRNEAFFNNFEVSSMKFWRSQQYRDFIEHIDSLGGIYVHRWGDAPIKTLALSIFVPLKEIHRFKNFNYSHHGIGPQFESGFLP